MTSIKCVSPSSNILFSYPRLFDRYIVLVKIITFFREEKKPLPRRVVKQKKKDTYREKMKNLLIGEMKDAPDVQSRVFVSH